MKRDYIDGNKNNVIFFVGKEVEHTPAYGMNTLFVVGVQNVKDIIWEAQSYHCDHIFCGANHSFDPMTEMLTNGKDLFDTIDPWDKMITALLEAGFLVTLDFNSTDLQKVLEMRCNEMENFIPQVCVRLPYVELLNYNAVLKIDDSDFKASNPGVWCHRIHKLMDPESFTPWRDYIKDKII